MAKNTNLINTNNNEHQINLDENLLGKFKITILPQEDLGLKETSTKVNIEIKTNAPEDLKPKLEVLGFKVTNFSNANSFTGTIGKDSLTQIIPFATQVTFLSSAPEASSGENVEELVVYTTGTVATTATATAIDSEAASLINLDDFQLDSRFAGIDGSGYSIVILDTGIDLDHEVFGPDNDGNGIADRIVYHHDFADNDGNASDTHGHGSHVSSIAAGVAPGANIIHLKVVPNYRRSTSSHYIEQALQWVVANASTYNVASVNISIGSGNVGRFVTTRFSNEYAALAAQDIVVSVASGNFGQTGVSVFSADPNVFSVGSVNDTSDRINSFSQRHETLTTVFAPGSPITAANAYGGYSTKSGTSMAAPYIAGIVPLAQELAVQEIGRRLTVPELRNLLRFTGVTINDWATGLDFKRVDVLTLGEAILALGGGGSPIPRVSFAAGNITQQEGNSGTTPYAFTVTLDRASDEVVTVNYSTNDGTATVANGDYIDNDGTLTFNPGETRKTITVLVNGDTTFEGHEHFTVTLDSANNGRISPITNTSTRTIIDDDVPPPTISITSILVVHQEGNSGTTPYAFTVTLDRASDEVVTVNYSTNDGTATVANGDYIDNDGTLTFNPEETSKTITVKVNGDTTFERSERFNVTLDNANNGEINLNGKTSWGIILNDDITPPPVISITPTPVTQQEGNSGTTAYAFTVTLDRASDEVVTVNYSTNDGTATVAHGDYIDNDGTLTFNPGETSKTITVQVNGDTTFERDETFFVNLNSASGANIATSQGTGTIENDDVSQVNGVAVNVNGTTGTYEVESYGGRQDKNPTVTIDRTEVEIEGNGWKKLDLGSYNITDNTVLEFEFRSTAEGEIHGIGFDNDNHISPHLISPHLTFQLHGTQLWGIQSSNDYITGEGWKSYQIPVGDFHFLRGQVRYLTLVNDDDGNAAGISEFRNIQLYEDLRPTAFLTPTTVTQQEGNSGTTAYAFTVTLDSASDDVVTVNYSTNDGTATVANGDYIDNDGTLTFNPRETSKTITVQVNGDTTVEGDEEFTVTLGSANNGIIDLNAKTSTGTIINDDVFPTVSITSTPVTQQEGDSGTTAYDFTVTLDSASDDVVTVNYSTNDGTATIANGDYIDNDGTLTFNPRETSKTITVEVNGDTTFEGNEQFTVTLDSANNGIIKSNANRGIGVILNDDVFPTVSITSTRVTQQEGDGGTTAYAFTVTLDSASDDVVTVNYSTNDGTATVANGDYIDNDGTLTFNPRETRKTITVEVNGDTTLEEDEAFFVNLNSASGANIATSQGTGTIENDDTPSVVSFAEYGSITLDHNWQTVTLDQSFINPVVIVSDPSSNDGDPAGVRLRNVSGNSFQLRIQEPEYLDDIHMSESVSFIVLEAGEHVLADGTRISAGTIDSQTLTSAGFESVALNNFSETPTILSQVQTFNGPQWVITRTTGQSATGFQVALQEEETLNGGWHRSETIGWLAMDSGSAVNGDTLLSGVTGRAHNHNQGTVNFGETFDAAPAVIAKLASFDGPNTANVRINSITSSGFDVNVDEEQSKDSETWHLNESVSFLALEGSSGTITGISNNGDINSQELDPFTGTDQGDFLF